MTTSWRRLAAFTAVGVVLLIAAAPTATDAVESVIGPTLSRVVHHPASSVVPAAAIARNGRINPDARLGRIVSAGSVITRTHLVDALLVAQPGALAWLLLAHRRRRRPLQDPIPPRQRGPDPSRAPPSSSSPTPLRVRAGLEVGRPRDGRRTRGEPQCPLPLTWSMEPMTS